MDTTRVADAPRLTSNERQTFALGVALLNPYGLTDEDRDRLVDAIARGAERVRTATNASVQQVADAVALDGWRRRALQWSLLNDAERMTSLFSLSELMYLGGAPAPSIADRVPFQTRSASD